MEDIFEDSKIRLKRAKEHIIKFKDMVNAFIDLKPYTRTIEPDPDGVHVLHKIKFTMRFPVILLGSGIDAIDNLRASLDLAWRALAIASGAVVPSAKAYFPFTDSLADFDNILRKGLKNFPNEIISLARRFKPYKGGDDLLWALNRICATNKHCLLNPIGIIINKFRIRKNKIVGSYMIPNPKWDRSKNEIVYLITKSDTTVTNNIDFALDIAFDKVDIISGEPAVAILNALAGKVQDILEALEGTARNLGCT